MRITSVILRVGVLVVLSWAITVGVSPAFGSPPNPPIPLSPADKAVGVSNSPQLRVSVSDPDGGSLGVTFYRTGTKFSFVMLPDTQWYTCTGWWYVDKDANPTYNYTRPRMTNDGPATFNAQTDWAVKNREGRNIAFVGHVGDIINDHAADPATSGQGLQTIPDPSNPDELSTLINQWDIASTAMMFLEDPVTTGLTHGMPFGMTIGNHDKMIDPPDDTTLFNEHFPASRFAGRPYYGGGYPTGTNDNSYQLFSAAGMDFIVICFRFTVPDGALTWAYNLVHNTYPTRRVIVMCHFVLDANSLLPEAPCGNQQPLICDGKKILTSPLGSEPNLFLMLCGHTAREGYLKYNRSGMQAVHIVMSDYSQRGHNTGEGLSVQGGGGWLKMLEFIPTSNQIHVMTYSPTMSNNAFNLNTASHAGQFEIDSNSDYTLSYTMSSAGAVPDQVIDTVSGVLSGSEASIVWPGLAGDTTYRWHATVSDGGSTVSGPSRSFTVGGTRMLTTAVIGGYGSLSPPSGLFNLGQVVDLTATPYINYGVRQWSGTDNDASKATTNTVTMNTDRSVTVEFERLWAIPGDFDHDYDVDTEDFGHLQECFSGTGVTQNDSACQDARLDNDTDVDKTDVGIFLNCMQGVGIPADPNCAG